MSYRDDRDDDRARDRGRDDRDRDRGRDDYRGGGGGYGGGGGGGGGFREPASGCSLMLRNVAEATT